MKLPSFSSDVIILSFDDLKPSSVDSRSLLELVLFLDSCLVVDFCGALCFLPN